MRRFFTIWTAWLVLGAVMLATTQSPPALGQRAKKDPKKAVQAGGKEEILPAGDRRRPDRPGYGGAAALGPGNKTAEKPALARKLEAIPEYVNVKAWREVAEALQDILDHPE